MVDEIVRQELWIIEVLRINSRIGWTYEVKFVNSMLGAAMKTLSSWRKLL